MRHSTRSAWRSCWPTGGGGTGEGGWDLPPSELARTAAPAQSSACARMWMRDGSRLPARPLLSHLPCPASLGRPKW